MRHNRFGLQIKSRGTVRRKKVGDSKVRIRSVKNRGNDFLMLEYYWAGERHQKMIRHASQADERKAKAMAQEIAGYSSAQAMKALEETFRETMPPGMGYDYMGMSFQEKKAQEGVSPGLVFGLSLLFVFLILAALY